MIVSHSYHVSSYRMASPDCGVVWSSFFIFSWGISPLKSARRVYFISFSTPSSLGAHLCKLFKLQNIKLNLTAKYDNHLSTTPPISHLKVSLGVRIPTDERLLYSSTYFSTWLVACF